MKNQLRSLLVLLLWLAAVDAARAQGTAFTYQGRLDENSAAANGSYDLQFAIFNVPVGGTQLGSALTSNATPVSNGLFTVTLDFGAGVFTGANRWLEIGVRTNGGGAFTTLEQRLVALEKLLDGKTLNQNQ